MLHNDGLEEDLTATVSKCLKSVAFPIGQFFTDTDGEVN